MRARKTDGNHRQLREDWRNLGGSWLDITPNTGGEPDALVGFRGRQFLIEIKDPRAQKSDQKLRPKQIAWHRSWSGAHVHTVLCLSDILELFKDSTPPTPDSPSARS